MRDGSRRDSHNRSTIFVLFLTYVLSTHTHVHHNIDSSSYTMATTVTHCMVEQYKHIVQPNILRDALCGFWSCVKYLVT